MNTLRELEHDETTRTQIKINFKESGGLNSAKDDAY